MHHSVVTNLVVFLPPDCQHGVAAACGLTDQSDVAEAKSLLRRRLARDHWLGIIHCQHSTAISVIRTSAKCHEQLTAHSTR